MSITTTETCCSSHQPFAAFFAFLQPYRTRKIIFFVQKSGCLVEISEMKYGLCEQEKISVASSLKLSSYSSFVAGPVRAIMANLKPKSCLHNRSPASHSYVRFHSIWGPTKKNSSIKSDRMRCSFSVTKAASRVDSICSFYGETRLAATEQEENLIG